MRNSWRWLAGAVPLLGVALATPALAQQAPLPVGVVEAEPPLGFVFDPDLRWGDDSRYLEIYGQINKGLLVFDDGLESIPFFPVDNANSSSRIGIRSLTTLNEDWTVGFNLEFEWNPYSTNNVNQTNRDVFDWETFLLRKGEVYITGEEFGKVWLGQGSMASDGTAEVDLSGTDVVGYSAVSDIAGGPFFRMTDNTLSATKVKDVFSNFDGLGRKARIRYDSPSFSGFTLSSSVGTQVVPTETGVVVWDVAARYSNTFEDFEVAGALAFSMPAPDSSLVDGSFSVLHVPSGVSLTVASAFESAPTINGRYGYAKLGYQHDFFDFGTTAMSIDGYVGEEVGAVGSTSKSIGAQLVQNVDDWQTEFYLGGRLFEYDETAADFNDGVAVLAGGRTKF